MPLPKFFLSVSIVVAGFGLVACSGETNDTDMAGEGAESTASSDRSAAAKPKAAIVWKPEERLALQRVAIAAEPGDVLLLGEGVFEPFWMPVPVVLRGVGPEETIIEARRDSEWRLEFPEGEGVSGLEKLSVRVAPDELGNDWWNLATGAQFQGDCVVRDVVIGPGLGNGLGAGDGRILLENVQVEGCQRVGVSLGGTRAGTVVDGLTVTGTSEEGFDLEIGGYSLGTFRNLNLSGEGSGTVVVSGGYASPQFEGMDPVDFDEIYFEAGALPEGRSEEEVEIAYEAYLEEEGLNYDMRSAYAKEARQTSPERRELARDYLARLETVDSLETATEALLDYVYELSELSQSGVRQGYYMQAAGLELNAFVERWGAGALEEIFFQLPTLALSQWELYPPLIDDKELSAALEAIAHSPPPDAGQRKSRRVIEREESRLAQLEEALRPIGEIGAETAPEEVARVLASALLKAGEVVDSAGDDNEGAAMKASLIEVLQGAMDAAVSRGDEATVIEIVAALPATERPSMPSRRELIRNLDTEMKRAVAQALRERR